MKSRQLVAEGSSTLAICGILYLKSDLINNMDHMRISGTKLSSLIKQM